MSIKKLETLDADGEETGVLYFGDRATLMVFITGTITVTPSVGPTSSGPWLVKSENALTASGDLVLDGPAYVKLVASGVSSGSADVYAGVL